MTLKNGVAAVLTGIFLITGAHGVMAAKTSLEMGKEMFNNPKLGESTNESSCSSCHAEGKGLENARQAKKLSKLVNRCLVEKMAGNKIDGRLVPMRSLKMYVKSLAE